MSTLLGGENNAASTEHHRLDAHPHDSAADGISVHQLETWSKKKKDVREKHVPLVM